MCKWFVRLVFTQCFSYLLCLFIVLIDFLQSGNADVDFIRWRDGPYNVGPYDYCCTFL